ncbi:helix-turn-helix domain-containing protein [Campylobacter suis]|uniref:Winged helix-turn-helix domain-containing protein n=1 Tax=Campylobacter suis TaxID=2790657 RepID=A0ABM8Q5R3_9BACT|nr:helix-turn-helix domain-containing protein [Campylobacter suis]CAD7288251.1 hypothetical protein LMG8286_01219 [Campylobacter suis]
MASETQIDRVKTTLKEKGYITRNECLSRFISRLGAIIYRLKERGWEFRVEYFKTQYGKDYKYTLVKLPMEETI